MRIEDIQAFCGQQVSVWQGGRLVAEGLLDSVDVISAPEPQADGEGWRLEQVLVLVVDDEAHRVDFGVSVVPRD